MPGAAAAHTPDATPPLPLTPNEQLRCAREVLRVEAIALWGVSNRLGEGFVRAAELIYRTKGSVIVTGMGKAGLVGQKVAATLASTGARAHFLHPAEAFHGDLGRVDAADVILMLTQSGETSEVTQLLPSLRRLGVPIVAITRSAGATVGRAAEAVIELGDLEEACALGLAPSTSTTAMIAIGDALALVVSRMRGFQAEDFARLHPGGALGRKLSRVDDVMRPLSECRVTGVHQSTREVLVSTSRPGRRTGAIMLVDDEGRLAGLFTDSDLARLFERRDERALDLPVASLMAPSPATIRAGAKTSEAIAMLADRKYSELPVLDEAGRPVGLIDVTDIVGLSVEGNRGEKSPPAPRAAAAPTTIRVYPGEDLYAAG